LSVIYCGTGDGREQIVHTEMPLACWMGLTIQDLNAKLWYLILGLSSKAWPQIKPSILVQRERVCVLLDQAFIFPFPSII